METTVLHSGEGENGVVSFVLGIPVFESVPALSPLYDLIIKSQLSEEDCGNAPASTRSMRFYAVSNICVNV